MSTSALDRIGAQRRVVALLARALAGDRVAHAYAFVGAPGSGRKAAALAFAAALLCERSGCGACRACRMADAGAHPDLHVIVPTPPATNPRGPKAIRIDTIRELERRASLKPVMAPRKVFVLTEADRMTEDAPQAFLKTLEEPPDRTVMILILERARAVPATVLSRCQIVRFEPRASEAAPERAAAEALLAEVRERGMTAAFARFDRARPDREEAEAVVDVWWLWGRDLLLTKAGAPAELLTEPERASGLAREAEAWSLDAIVGAITRCREAREALAVNVAPRLTLEVLLTTLALKVA